LPRNLANYFANPNKAIFLPKNHQLKMKKYILSIFLSICCISTLLQAQNNFRLDTIKVDNNDNRNINARKNKSNTTDLSEKSSKVMGEKNEINGFDKTKLRFGANLGLSLSRNYTVLGLGPQIGYSFSNYFMAGAGIKYYYTKTRTYDYEDSYLYKNNLMGANIFGYIYPIKFITLFAQPELNYIWTSVENEATHEISKSDGIVPSLVVGAGLRLGFTHITLNYDLIHEVNSPYPDGIFLGVSAFF
jgi:hypothetical protein